MVPHPPGLPCHYSLSNREILLIYIFIRAVLLLNFNLTMRARIMVGNKPGEELSSP